MKKEEEKFTTSSEENGHYLFGHDWKVDEKGKVIFINEN